MFCQLTVAGEKTYHERRVEIAWLCATAPYSAVHTVSALMFSVYVRAMVRYSVVVNTSGVMGLAVVIGMDGHTVETW